MDPKQQQIPSQPVDQTISSHPVQPSVSKLLLKGIIIFFIVLLIFVGAGAYIFGTYQGVRQKANSLVNHGTLVQPLTKNIQISQIPQAITVAPKPSIPNDWKSFTSTTHRFSVQYSPSTYVQEFSTPYYYITVYPNPNTVAAGVHAMPIFVISVLADTFNTTNVAAYNFTSNDWITYLSQLTVGQSTTTGSGIVFTRRADTTVGGERALNFLIVAKGFRQQRVYVKENGFWYSIADYYQNEPDPDQYDIFLSSFKFIQ